MSMSAYPLEPKDRATSIRLGKLLGTELDPEPGGDCTTSVRLLHNVRQPPVRQSAVADWMACPRKYLFKHRFGLRLRYALPSRPRQRGSMFHKIMQEYTLGHAEEGTLIALRREIDAWRDEMGKAKDPDYEAIHLAAVQSERDLALALAMAKVYQSKYPRDPALGVLGVELKLRTPPAHPLPEMVGTLDLLLMTPSGEVEIHDYKTTRRPPSTVIRGSNFDLQKLMYRILTLVHLDREGIPLAALKRFVTHVIQVPAIEFCGKDRDYAEVSRVLTRGPRKGETVVERVYSGEPKFENYLKRVGDLYAGTGEYAEQHDARLVDPMIQQSSFTYGGGRNLPLELKIILDEMRRASLCRPDLHRYYRVRSACFQHGSMCPYMKLCENDPHAWASFVNADYRVEPETEATQGDDDE